MSTMTKHQVMAEIVDICESYARAFIQVSGHEPPQQEAKEIKRALSIRIEAIAARLTGAK
jgi:hypothetical protein